MSADVRELQQMLALTAGDADVDRGAIFGKISDLFLGEQDTKPTDREKALMGDILQRLLKDVEMQMRKTLSEKLSLRADAPKDLVLALANDEIPVAQPILEHSPVLEDDELVEIIKQRTYEHQLAVAMRRGIGTKVTEALVETKNEDVVKTMLENPDTQISQTTIEYLVEQSERVDAYQNPLLRHPELGQDLAKKMYRWVGDALQKEIVEKYQIDAKELSEALQTTVEDVLRNSSEDENLDRVTQLVDQIEKSGRLTTQNLMKVIQEGEIPLFLVMFGRLSGLSSRQVRRIILGSEGDVFVLACRAVGVTRDEFTQLFKLCRAARPSKQDMQVSEMTYLLKYFDQLKPESAKAALYTWQNSVEAKSEKLRKGS